MADSAETALLPAGLHDLLPPDAAHEAALIERLMEAFAARGYDRVKPPLVEFETTLVADPGLSEQVFRMMDPVSQRMMGVRADMTLQIARIAATRLKNAPRPLRLSYAGQVLRVRGTQLRPERQFAQAGVELIGSDTIAADVEVALGAVAALAAAGVGDLTLDLNSPALAAAAVAELDLDEAARDRLRVALDRKDTAAVREIADSPLFPALIAAVGPAEAVLERLGGLDLPPAAAAEADRLGDVVAGLRAALPGLILTLDAVEYRGFEYQTGVSFTLFARGVRGELGRGGRYATAGGEAATGFTLFLDTLLRAVAAPPAHRRLYLPHGTPERDAVRLRGEGWVTVAGLAPAADAEPEARRLGCDHLWHGDGVSPVSES